MKNILFVIAFGSPIWFSGMAQKYICKGEPVSIVKPTVRGDFYWQESSNGKDWSRLGSVSGDTILLSPERSAWYRVEVYEGDCEVLYSSVIELEVVQIPQLTIPKLDSVCENSLPFSLGGATPLGGMFKGPGIVDNIFSPEMVGPGNSPYYYVYQESLAGCRDSVFGSIWVIPKPDQTYAGEDQVDIMSDSTLLAAKIPAYGRGVWRIISGQGGVIQDSLNPNTVIYKGRLEEVYVLEWTVSNSCGSSSDRVKIEFMETSIKPCPDQAFVFDVDGNRYKTIQIGDQCWMGENLKVGKLVNSTIGTRAHSNVEDNEIIEVYAWNNDPDSLSFYGGLYDWDEMMNYSDQEGSQGICPDGWHIPAKKEWRKLDDYFEDNDTGWALQVDGSSGFNAVLSGNRNAMGSFYSLGSSNLYWTSTTYSYNGANEGYFIMMVSCNEYLRWDRINKRTGASIRCLKNE